MKINRSLYVNEIDNFFLSRINKHPIQNNENIPRSAGNTIKTPQIRHPSPLQP